MTMVTRQIVGYDPDTQGCSMLYSESLMQQLSTF
jgi:hypothetical protein